MSDFDRWIAERVVTRPEPALTLATRAQRQGCRVEITLKPFTGHTVFFGQHGRQDDRIEDAIAHAARDWEGARA